jgi:septal ring factor EnvC (AmiA/AmiB activator)
MTVARIFIIVLILSGGWTGQASADDPSKKEIEKLIQDEKWELESLKKKIEKQGRKISSIDKKETQILKFLGTLEVQKKIRERELQIYRWNIKINKKQMDQLSRKIKGAEKRLARQESMLGKRLRILYKQGKMSPVKILFSAEDYSDLIQKMKYLELQMSHDSRVFENYQRYLKQLREEEQKLFKAKSRLAQFESAALHKKNEIEQKKGKKSDFLRKIKSKKIYFIQARKELLKASENLNDLISRLEKKRLSGEGLSLADKKGRLFYPVQGKILNRFGRVKDKQFGTHIINNGLNLKVKKGTEVHPIFQGPVLFAGPLVGYGNLIIVGHGEHYHSLYGHLDKMLVQTGDYVHEHQAIGLSGDSGSLVGETLYLELRHKGKPIDPAPWLQVAKRK